MANPSINRFLEDRMMDSIDHALGRPIFPLQETYRNRYFIEPDCDEGRAMASSPFWREAGTNGGSLTCFEVTEDGRRALADHLKSIRDPWRLFEVTFEGAAETIAATSFANAKYRKWLEVSDSWSELTFGQFIAASRVRLASGVSHG